MVIRTAFRSCLILVALSLAAAVSQAAIWNVSQSWELDNAVASLSPGDTIICAPGDYYPGHALYFAAPDVTLTGATSNRDDVRIHGAGMNVDGGGLNNLIHLAASGITIENLTVQDVNQNAIQIHGEYGLSGTNILNVHTLNVGERHIKGSGPVSQGQYDDYNVTIQGCLIEQTLERSGYAENNYDYVGGIDAMGTNNWLVRGNVFKGIQTPNADCRGAVFIWNGTNDTVENNVFLGCDRSISFGNPSSSFGPDHSIIRNNFIVCGDNDAMEICTTDNVKIYNNTVYNSDPNYDKTVFVYGPQINLQSENNLIHGGTLFVGGAWTDTNSIIGPAVNSNWFVDPSSGDLHLTALATAAIDHGIALPDVATDFDGQVRGSRPDIGADELVPEPASLTLIGLAAAAMVRRKKA